jgi:flagellar hook-associated protein 2
MQQDYDDYDDKIDDWEEKVADMEDYYYKKFSAMETALSTLQSSTSSLSALLGTNS